MSFSDRQALKMLGLAFLAQNLALGLTYGTYGAFVLPFTEEFAAPRSLAGSGLAVTALMMGVLSPWTGKLVARHSIARVMAVGALCMALGFALLALAQSMIMVLILFALIGVGMVLLGPIPVMSLIANWFSVGRGTALGLGMLPLGIFVMPPIATGLVEGLGWRGACLVLAAVLVLSLPVVLRVRSHPERAVAGTGDGGSRPVPMGAFLREPAFMVIVIAYAVVAGGGAAITAHLIPYGRGLGFDAAQAAFMLSVYGAASATGSFLFGWLADRLGGVMALLVNALLHALSWALMLSGGLYPAVLVWSGLMGLGAGGLTIALSATLGERYDPARFSQGLGLALAMNMPFTFGTAPFMGWIYDVSDSYALSFAILIALYLAAAVVFAGFMLSGAHRRA